MAVSTNQVLTHRLMNHRPFRNALIVLIFVCIWLGLLIVPVEGVSPNRNITNAEEGLWWAITTASGVGYGDYYPVTLEGRLIGAALQISGVVMFGLIIGIIGITLNKKQEEYYWFRLFDRLNQLEEHIQNVEKETRFLVMGSRDLDSETKKEKKSSHE